MNHLDARRHLQVASLDHAMWFMRMFRADEWLLYDQSSPSACGGRALTQGKIFNRYGEMVAAVMQEGLTRFRPPGDDADKERVRGGAGQFNPVSDDADKEREVRGGGTPSPLAGESGAS